MAAITPQAWIARCAGVQKVSRPIERCQETSHAPPMEAEVTASAPNHRYQGTLASPDTTCATRWVESGILDIIPLTLLALSYNVDYPSPHCPRVNHFQSISYGTSMPVKYS